MNNDWVNPKYRSAIEALGFDKTMQMSQGGNCIGCGGTGRVIYMDPSTGTMKDIPCMSCGGSGQSSL